MFDSALPQFFRIFKGILKLYYAHNKQIKNLKEVIKMKQNMKRISVMMLSGILCLGAAQNAFAASKAGSGKSELSSYNAELATQRTRLGELISMNKQLTTQIAVAQHSVKEAGLINKTISNELKDMSEEIKAKRMELTESRSDRQSLRADAKAARLAGDYSTAKEKLIKLAEVQDEQIKDRMDLADLLNKKLAYLNAVKNGNVTEVDDTEASPETEETSTAETAGEVISDENTANDTPADDSAVAAEGSEAVDTTPADEAEIAAAFDDGAELDIDDISAAEAL